MQKQSESSFLSFSLKLDAIFTQYTALLFPTPHQSPPSSDDLLSQLNELDFLNFKLRTALLSLSHDLAHFSQQLLTYQQRIRDEKEEIRELQGRQRAEEQAATSKEKFNLMGKELMQWGKRREVEERNAQLRQEIQTMEEQYAADMEDYLKQEQYLRKSMACLRSFLTSLHPEDPSPPSP